MRFLRYGAYLAAVLLAFANPALAEMAEHAAEGVAAGGVDWKAIMAGPTIAIAALCGAFAQAKVAATALEGIGKNPGSAGSMNTPMILGLALIESLVIYALLVALILADFI